MAGFVAAALRGQAAGERPAPGLAAQLAALAAEDKPIAAQWVALAMAPGRAALDRRKAALPRIRDLADAEARLDWVNPRGTFPCGARTLPYGHPAGARVAAPPEGRRCIGRLEPFRCAIR